MHRETLSANYDLKQGQDHENLATGVYISPDVEGKHPFGQISVSDNKTTEIPDTLAEAETLLGTDVVLANNIRMLRLDITNPLRESAKRENGHSARIVMTEAQKAQAKQNRKEASEKLAVISGFSIEDLMKLVRK